MNSETDFTRGPRESNEGAEALYAKLLGHCVDSRKRVSLEHIWEALTHLRSLGAERYSIAIVARTVAALGHSGPKEQSIRNREGSDYKELILAFAEEYGPHRQNRLPTSDNDLAASIGDLRVAAIVRGIIAENKSLKRRLDLTKNALSRLSRSAIADAVGQPAAVHVPAPVSIKPLPFTPTEIAGVRSFLDRLPDLEQDLRLSLDPSSGALLWRNGVIELAGAGFRQALIRIIESCADG